MVVVCIANRDTDNTVKASKFNKDIYINLAKNEGEQRKKWSEFYDVKMFLYCNKFEETMLWKNPRVSLEALFDAILQQQPRSEEKSFREFSTLTELQEFVKTITEFDMCI